MNRRRTKKEKKQSIKLNFLENNFTGFSINRVICCSAPFFQIRFLFSRKFRIESFLILWSHTHNNMYNRKAHTSTMKNVYILNKMFTAYIHIIYYYVAFLLVRVITYKTQDAITVHELFFSTRKLRNNWRFFPDERRRGSVRNKIDAHARMRKSRNLLDARRCASVNCSRGYRGKRARRRISVRASTVYIVRRRGGGGEQRSRRRRLGRGRGRRVRVVTPPRSVHGPSDRNIFT